MNAVSLSTFVRSEFGPNFVELPTASPATTTVSTVVTAAPATTASVAVPQPVAEDETTAGIVLAVIFGVLGSVAIFAILRVLCSLAEKKTKKHGRKHHKTKEIVAACCPPL